MNEGKHLLGIPGHFVFAFFPTAQTTHSSLMTLMNPEITEHEVFLSSQPAFTGLPYKPDALTSTRSGKLVENRLA